MSFPPLLFLSFFNSHLVLILGSKVTGLPPYLGMLGGLGVMWLLTDVIHAGEKVLDEVD
jgi:hypothetical protein